MQTGDLLKPALYEEGATIPQLKGGKCACGYVFFPMQMYGCEVCGRNGDDLSPANLPAEGVVVSAATVHLHQGRHRKAPFDVCVVKLDSGPLIKGLLESVDTPLAPGTPVQGVFCEVPGKEDGQTALDLRFKAR